MPPIQKTHVYKVSRNGVYLGLLRDVKNPFSFVQDINSAGSSINIVVPFTFDNAFEEVEPLMTEDGNPILDENGEAIYIERSIDKIGNSDESILIRNGNTVEVYEFSSYNPNGKIMFSGVINRLEAMFDGQSNGEVATITVFSHGSDLDNYIIQDGS